jgi:glucose-1-phosphate cytidylyltransferase
MKTVILCGGLGTRLREETEYRPKPLIEIGARPILWHIMKLYACYNAKEFVLCLGYKAHMIKDYFLNYEAMNNDVTLSLGKPQSLLVHGAHDERDYSVTLVDTGLNTMTGGRIRRIREYVGDETFMVTYGDGVSNVDISKLLEFHHSHGRIATVTTVQPISRYGVLRIGSNNLVTEFVEKPQLEDRVSAGFFVFNREIFNYLDGDDIVLEQEPMRRLVEDGQLMAYHHSGFFYAMDTFREFLYLNELWDSGKAPWKIW